MSGAASPTPALGPGFPEEWYGWNLVAQPRMKLWAGTRLGPRSFDPYLVDTIEEGARLLFSPESNDDWPLFELRTPYEVTPAYRINLTRPLWRRTPDEIIEPRGAVTGPSGAPFDQIMDDTVMAIWYEGRFRYGNNPFSVHWAPRRRCAMLRVGGRDAEDADRIWNQCATVIRRIYREVTGWGQGLRSSTSKRRPVNI